MDTFAAGSPVTTSRRLLVTGRHGFVGGILAKMLDAPLHRGHWELADISPDLDLRDSEAANALVDQAAPDAVIHLAAQSAVPDSFRDPETTLQINLVGTLHLLQALKRSRFTGRMLYVSSGEVYGLVPESELPVTEERIARPRNPYAVSKLAAEALCAQWAMTESLDLVIARPFNHVGAGQSDRFAVSDFARQIAVIKREGSAPIVRAGNIDVTRDFTDVKDVVEAYFGLLDRGRAGEIYNVCSGQETSIRAILDKLVALSGVAITVDREPDRMRPSEHRRMFGDPRKIREHTQWHPVVPLERSLGAALQYWETSLSKVR